MHAMLRHAALCDWGDFKRFLISLSFQPAVYSKRNQEMENNYMWEHGITDRR